MTFRTGRLGVLGLASNRHVNLPFQSWEMRPETGKNSNGGVLLSITGAIIQVEFLVRVRLLSNFQRIFMAGTVAKVCLIFVECIIQFL